MFNHFLSTKYMFLMLRLCSFIILVHFFSYINCKADLIRKSNNTFSYPNKPQLFDYHSADLLPGISFTKPICIRATNANGGELFIAEQEGRVWRVTNLSSQPKKTLFLDLSTRVHSKQESGFIGFELHPQFEKNGYFYAFYTFLTSIGGNEGLHDRLSQFQFNGKVGAMADIKTEKAMFTQFDQHYDHNAGDLHFGPDGYLYISLGDEGGSYDQYNNSQRIDRDYFGGILRIDVNQQKNNLPPNGHIGLHGNYLVPRDNPYVGATSFAGLPINPKKIRTEFWAVGLRNPWRMAFDPKSGKLYTGDTGDHVREEINIIKRGGNYGYPIFEGTPEGPKYNASAKRNDYIFPEAEYGRAHGNDIAGLHFYRGNQPEELDGHIIFSDYWSGWIGAVDFNHSRDSQRPIRWLFWDDNISSLGEHPITGEILLADHREGLIKKLISGRNPHEQPLPLKLSETGLFRDLARMVMHEGIIPYKVTNPLWSDGAHKQRWFTIADNKSQIHFNAYKPWIFPNGSAWIKHFELDVFEDGLIKRKKLETRIIYKTKSFWYGTTYRWNDQQTDAILVNPEGSSEEYTILKNGELTKLTYNYPSRRECFSCHNSQSKGILGFHTAQLNRSINYGDGEENQLKALSKAGYLDREINEPSTYPALAALNDESKSLEFRAVSFIESNCAYCHRPGLSGVAQAKFDARLETPISFSKLINGKPHNNFGNVRKKFIHPGEPDLSVVYNRISKPGLHKMPPLGSSLIYPAAVNVMERWIREMNGKQFIGNANADNDGDGQNNYTEFLLDTNANNSTDLFIPSVRSNLNGSELDFILPANRDLIIYKTTDLGIGKWEMVKGLKYIPYSNTKQRVRIREPIAQQRFYRIQVREP